MGGDTDRRPGPITITITAVGSVPQGRMVRRDTARPAMPCSCRARWAMRRSACCCAEARLAAAWGLPAAEAEHLRRRYLRPEPRLGLGQALREHATAAMDISDGLAKDLGRMCRASGCGARVRLADLPLSAAAARRSRPTPSWSLASSQAATTTRCCPPFP